MRHIALERPGHFIASDGPTPSPEPGEALVRVHRIGVCGTDLHAFAGRQPFFNYPRILGHELGVEILDPGSDPHGLKTGDRCAVEPYINCGRCHRVPRRRSNCCAELKALGVHVDGGMRLQMAVPARKLHRSRTLAYDQLALVETLAIGAHAVDRAASREMTSCSSSAQVRLASACASSGGACPTLAVMDVKESRLDFCRRHLGVTHTLAGGVDVTEQLRGIGGGDLPTIVLDATGNAVSMEGAFELPAQGGRIVFVGLFQGEVSFHDPNFHRRELSLFASRNALPGNFREIIALIEAGRIDTAPWITHRFDLVDTPQRFPEFAEDPSVIKTVISVSV